ncbi:hypothetical protein P700755_001741 [Psychroflexus torquis ATCC 700755]|uniref:Uncharacterized protein n=1 Tax=Psychroflexus torquis (strain ATCC 700755 / CIP 106069 / ACAM 623) TaxID=313595 RepID=K4IHQ7_PSYTT|nr:hypothetical protein P700755_001741 [Psychroflexus torquis ATCC 700755]
MYNSSIILVNWIIGDSRRTNLDYSPVLVVIHNSVLKTPLTSTAPFWWPISAAHDSGF